jgi:hypothetical protein
VSAGHLPASGTIRAAHRRAALAWGFALVLGAASWAMARHAAVALPPPRPLEELSYYPSGEFLRPATLGFAEAAADIAWFRAVQYYGEHRFTDNRFTRMEQVFDILTTLSPGFLAAYEFGSFALAQEGNDFPAAERLMLKGLAANPRSGELAFQAGFLYYIRTGGRDYRHAAEYFAQAARQADAPPAAARFAAFARQQSGDLEMAYELWQQVEATSQNPYMKEMAEKQLRTIRAALAAGRPDLAIRPLPTPRVIVR